ncbi:MAG: GerAB/ArcD/ProY family transporter [Clostridia bacterium]
MNLREGKMGRQETIALLSTSLFISAVFTVNSSETYSTGNSTYLTLPISILLSVVIFLIVSFALKKSGQGGLMEMARYAFGPIGEFIYAFVLIAGLLIAAIIPTDNFLLVMQSYLYVDSDYTEIIIYIVPVIAILAFIGFEGLGRTAKLLSWVFIIILFVTFFNLGESLETYRLAPFLGDGVEHMATISINSMYCFLPGLLSIFTLTRGTQGEKNAKFSGVTSGIIAAVIVFITQLIIGMAFSYNELKDIFMPFYVINTISGNDSYLIRTEKLTVFIFLLGGIIAAAYYIYGAARIYVREFKQRDIRPAIASFSAILLTLVISKHVGMHYIKGVLEFASKYMTAILIIPTLLMCISALIRTSICEKKGIINES